MEEKVLRKAKSIHGIDIPKPYNTFDFAERVSKDGGVVESLAELDDFDNKLVDEPSFVLKPHGIKEGKNYSFIPTPIYGRELIINGGFDTTSSWTVSTEPTISAGVANILSTDGSYQYIYQTTGDYGLKSGRYYVMKYEIIENLSGSLKFSSGFTSQGVLDSSVGTHEVRFLCADDNVLYIERNVGVTNVTIDNISIREVIKNSDGTHSRNSVAYRTNEFNQLEEVGANVPRINYKHFEKLEDGSYKNIGEPELLLEGQSENLIPYSEDFSQGYWAKGRSTVTLNATRSPRGDETATKWQMTSEEGAHYLRGASTKDGIYTQSIYIKRGNYDFIRVSVYFSNITIDLTNGNIMSKLGDATVEHVVDGWYRISASSNISNIYSYNGITLCDSSGFDLLDPIGDEFFYVWGAQLEQASSPSSYMKTTGSTFTRLADTSTDYGDVSCFNSEEGTMIIEMAELGSRKYKILSISNNSVDERIYLQYTPTENELILVSKIGGATEGWITYDLSGSTQSNRIAVTWKEDLFKMVINGVIIDESLGSVSAPGTYTTFSFHDGIGNNALEAEVREVQVYKTALSDEKLVELTTWNEFIKMKQSLGYE